MTFGWHLKRWFIGLGFMLGLVLLMFGTVSAAVGAASPKLAASVEVGQKTGLGLSVIDATKILAKQGIAPSFFTPNLRTAPLGSAPKTSLNANSAITVFLPTITQIYNTKVFLPTVTQMHTTAPPLCRYGVAAWGAQLKWLPTWRAGWTLDFSAHRPPAGLAAEFVQVIRISQQKNGCEYLDGFSTQPALTEAALGAVIKSAPGATWLVGNEPDRGPNPENCLMRGQDDVHPEVYARAYHDVYQFIKQRDPAARIGVAGLVQVTPGRLQYLDKVWGTYAQQYGHMMPIDIWNMHIYILPEALPDGRPNGIANIALGTDPALAIRESGGDPSACADPGVYCYAEHDDMMVFAQQITAMRTWMKQHGQQNKPLWLSEFSLLYPYEIDSTGCYLQDEYGNCFTPERVSNFMKRSFKYLETALDSDLGFPLDGYRLVQRWLWFAAYVPAETAGHSSNLLTNTLDQLTFVGQTLQDETRSRSGDVNLLLDRVGGFSSYTTKPGSAATVTLFVTVLNNGSLATAAPIKITFYSDSALTKPIGTTTISSPIHGCVAQPVRAEVAWMDLPTGIYPFWVKVDDTNVIIETNEADNIAKGTVTVYTHHTMLPMLLHR